MVMKKAYFLLFFALLLWGGGGAGFAKAPSEVRLISLENGNAMLILSLAEGWYSYAPEVKSGGIAPEIDWGGSENLRELRAHFPKGEKYEIPALGAFYGYGGEVLVPLVLVAKNPAEPVRLVIGFHYGICKNICVPVSASLSLVLAPR